MHKRHLLHITYFLNFFVAFHTFAVLYIHSSVLAAAWGERMVGFLFALASLAALGMLAYMPRILRRVGDIRWSVALMTGSIVSVIGLAVSTSPLVIALCFIAQTAFLRALLVDLDVILESVSENADTGVVRGIFLTVANTALIFAPLLTGLLLDSTDSYGRAYLFSAAVLLPGLFLVAFSFRHFRDPRYVSSPLAATLKKLEQRHDVARIMAVDFALRFFYAWMVIYTPLYLHRYVGLPWSEIGVIFMVMLVPFALFELPLGTLADKAYGEKEILISGLAIMGIATMALTTIHSSSLLIWMAALLMTRVGAAAVEIMDETYFFKHVHKEEADIIRLFRSIEPFAYVVAAALASVLLFIVPVSYLFVILGMLVLAAIPVAAKLKDTR